MKIFENLNRIFESFSKQTALIHNLEKTVTKTKVNFVFKFQFANMSHIHDFYYIVHPYLKNLPFKSHVKKNYQDYLELSFNFEKLKLRNHIKDIQTLEKSLTTINKFNL